VVDALLTKAKGYGERSAAVKMLSQTSLLARAAWEGGVRTIFFSRAFTSSQRSLKTVMDERTRRTS
jgi:hypothetical protein